MLYRYFVRYSLDGKAASKIVHMARIISSIDEIMEISERIRGETGIDPMADCDVNIDWFKLIATWEDGCTTPVP